ncbi:M20/M25/M40 family metallo-hydrolase [Hymenobacter busanensis]|uniref:M20/M25/M40 family metallo-hydrolase n=1 Tax=Hymenobacter busanensis TaxID=2607656 RepID=A0A7L5A0S1_9BACT|nr:M20/M25/M40 family metallo-hydrolase [Hymenobacter busanensis]KAA9333309.1 M20/M25/M40 family metallo-hydrolase [Hymenobacter busanensis]QHJ08012.1 M20/M25/M40 family metallo-hydrolase [Hymenobacter busanensis]
MKRIILGLLLAGAAPAAHGQQAAKPVKTKISAQTIERVEKTLADDKLRGRALNTGSAEAAQFLAGEFKRIGLQPLTGLTSFEQTFPAFEVRNAGLQATLNGAPVAADNVVLISGQEQVSWASGQSGAPRVVAIGPQADYRKEVVPLLYSKENVLILLDPAHAQRFKALANRFGRGSQFHPEKPTPNAIAVVLAPTTPTADATYQLTGSTSIKQLEIKNIVGVLPGRDKTKAAEQVVFSAHYDHIGILPAVAGDSIANGADDDASGTTAVVALAEHFKKTKQNARTLIFVAFTAEEIGGFGSQYFSKQLDPAKVTAMFNIEMIGKVSKFGPGAAFITGFDKSDFGPILQRNLQGSTFKFEPDPYPEQQLFYRSDNATLARLGVPAHSISTDQIPTDKLYHSVDDEVESLDLKNMTAVIEAIAVSARGIVAGTDTPTRIKDAGERK